MFEGKIFPPSLPLPWPTSPVPPPGTPSLLIGLTIIVTLLVITFTDFNFTDINRFSQHIGIEYNPTISGTELNLGIGISKAAYFLMTFERPAFVYGLLGCGAKKVTTQNCAEL